MTATIHPTASIASGVRLAAGVTIAPYAVIMGDVEIGEDTWIGPHVTIGTPAQFANRKFELAGEQCSGVRIGARVVLREYVTVHQPSRDVTIVEDDAYLMSYAHVSHDTRLRRGAVLANSALERAGLPQLRHWREALAAYLRERRARAPDRDVHAVHSARYANWLSALGGVDLQQGSGALRVV